MKIVIIGAGAVGGVIAASLTNEKLQVELVCKHRDVVDAIENNGLRVEGIKGNLITYPDTLLDISQISDRPDIVFIATKAYDVIPAARAIRPFLQDDTMVVSLQNGMCEDQIADIVGEQRTIGCVVNWGASMLGPGRMELTSDGSFVIGELSGEITHRMFVLRGLLEKIFPTHISSNIYGNLYTKLIVNSCITTLGAITGLRVGELLKIKIARTIFLKVFAEAVQVADCNGIKLEKIAERIDPYSLLLSSADRNGPISWPLIRKHLIIISLGFRFRRVKSSSLQSLERGKKTEIDFFNGYIVQKANSLHIPVPVNQRLVDMIKAIEKRKMKIEIENIFKILPETYSE
ncbi:2-dehydropantoate 2-reductase [candidate division KSB1 bacterium]|nr:2-dehydropantoate 2-reductase [candidate division KSB1 bacterium]